MAGILEIQNGSSSLEKLELSRLGSYTLGRRSANDVKVLDKAVSRHHCRVDYDG